MTADQFRQLALAIPNAVEQSHMGHPDFRIGKRIFASLGYPNANSAVLRLNLEEREMLVGAEPTMFSPVPGGWGKNGATILMLAHADEATARSALTMAAATASSGRLKAGGNGAIPPRPPSNHKDEAP